MNTDYVGWLTIDDTMIDYPVMKSSEEDPEYYLHRDFYGDDSVSGCLFIGEGCDSEQAFAFTLTMDGTEPNDVYEWYKNGVAQSEGLHPRDTFYLKHNETAEIAVPQDAVVTVNEQSGEYSTSFTLNDAPSQETRSLTFTVEDDTTLVVTNTLAYIVPTGIFDDMLIWWEIALLTAGFTAVFLWFRKIRGRLPYRRS